MESLEMIKKEFKQSFEAEENPKLVEDKNLKSKKGDQGAVYEKVNFSPAE
ncbi:27523_t:CDS:2 [Racocetra persica]|uniref:27523_t:CDS:1 n=1 Tax=Racocetra persica TaxID=160502 RepID=A0ACA9QSP6_9GLOM|nr:27523_t:CDS:2 [Racocetra persica]